MSNDIAVKAENTAVATRHSAAKIADAHLDKQSQLPSLTDAKRHFMPMTVEYWSPEKEGEEKLVFIAGVEHHEVPDMETGEIKSIECVLMLENQGDKLVRYISASRILVGNIKEAIRRTEIVPMTTLTPVSIKYLGLKKTKSGKNAARWQILPLIIEQGAA
ncbi:MAG: hypothetical protein KGZ88_12025 [Methylomicrobium sp.]|nr:hypothetical protein [Methylomicrobium sp.]